MVNLGDVSSFYISDKKLEEIEASLMQQGIQAHLLYLLPIETGIGFMEMLQVKMSDIQDDFIQVKNYKTGEIHHAPVSEKLKAVIFEHAAQKTADSYLLASDESDKEPLNTEKAFYTVVRAAEKVGEICYHEMLRKMFGYTRYNRRSDAVQLMQWYGFGSKEDTLDFIGVQSKGLEEQFKEFTNL